MGKRGYAAEVFMVILLSPQRDKVMQLFREGTVEVLVATDVAARGLDVSGVTHVFNFDIPPRIRKAMSIVLAVPDEPGGKPERLLLCHTAGDEPAKAD